MAVVFAVVPVLYVVSASVNPLGTVVSTDVIPTQFSLVHFRALFGEPSRPFPRWLLNTTVVCVVVTTGQVLCSALAAYAFSRFRFRGRRGGLLSLLLIQMFPQFLAVVALFTMFTEYRRGRTGARAEHAAGLQPGADGRGTGPGLADQGLLRHLPRQLDEAAMIDGAGHATIFFRIILPLAGPILAVTGLLAFVGVIGEFLDGLVSS